MHIEPGLLSSAKTLLADAAAFSILGALSSQILGHPNGVLKTAVAALFFSMFMQAFHVPVGGSELHFIGASVIYLLFGFGPTLFGFALGLVLQGSLFEPADLIHWGVNTLSLIIPLTAVHYGIGHTFVAQRRVCWQEVLKFDALFYSGVVLMVGFWFSLGDEPTAFRDWGAFAASYIPVVLCEPLLSCLLIRQLKPYAHRDAVQRITQIGALRLS